MQKSISFDMFKELKGRKICFLNIRSLLPNINELRYCLEGSDVFACCICESWLNKRLHNKLIEIRGYEIYRLERRTGKRGGGLVIYINKTVRSEVLEQDEPSSTYSTSDIEMLTVLIKPEKQRNIILTVVYIPPSANKKVAVQELAARLERLNIKNKIYQLVGGDFNIDSGPKSSKNDSNLIKLFESKLNLKQLITIPTRTTVKSASIIDLIYVSDSEVTIMSGVAKCNFSDHDFVYLALKKPPFKKEKVSFQYRDIKNLNVAALNHFFESYDWTNLYNSNDSETCWNLLLNTYTYGVDMYAPLISVNNVLKREEWMNNDALSAIHSRDKLRDKLSSYPDIDNRTNIDVNSEYYKKKLKLKQEFNAARNKARQLINKARYNHIQEKLHNIKASPKKFWNELKMYMPGKKDKGSSATTKITLADSKGNLLVNDLDSANLINQFFVNIGPELSSKIHSDNSNYLKEMEKVIWNPKMLEKFEPITNAELEILIKEIDTSKSSNVPGINNRLLKLCLLSTISQTCYLLNLILDSTV